MQDNGTLTPGQRFDRIERAIEELSHRVQRLEYRVLFFSGGVAIATPVVTAFLIRLFDKLWST